MSRHLLQFDGASEPNPGQSGSAYVLFSPILIDEHGTQYRDVIQEGYKFFEYATNNEAEYNGLILGLESALKLGIEEIDVEGDSNLIIQQVTGAWKVKVDRLVPLKSKASSLLHKFKKYTIKHIYREENTDADRLSKEAILIKREDHRSI